MGDDEYISDTGIAGQSVSALDRWDSVWKGEQAHIIVGLNSDIDTSGNPLPCLDRETRYLENLCAKFGLEILEGHGKDGAAWQDGRALLAEDGSP